MVECSTRADKTNQQTCRGLDMIDIVDTGTTISGTDFKIKHILNVPAGSSVQATY